MRKTITITESDYLKLTDMINYQKKRRQEALWNLSLFKATILDAEKVNSKDIPSQCVTIGLFNDDAFK